jgi:hypothetical protein
LLSEKNSSLSKIRANTPVIMGVSPKTTDINPDGMLRAE